MKLQRSFLLLVVVFGCNETLGLHAGRPRPEETGGTAGNGASAGSGVGGDGTSGTSGTSGGTNAGESGASGEAGSSPSGGTAGARGGSGGAGAGGSSGESGAGAGGGGACSTVECRAQGFDFCIEGQCADVTSPECDTILGDEWIEDDAEAEPHVIGALTRFDAEDPEAYRFYANLELAMQEFSAHGRIPIDGSERRPVLLLCHAPPRSGDLQPFRNALTHLIQDLDVSSILMFLLSRAELYALVEGRLAGLGEDVFFLDYAGATFDLLYLPDDVNDDPTFDPDLPSHIFGRLWHMLGDTSLMLESFVPLVERIEARVNPAPASGGTAEPTRLAFATGASNGYDDELAFWLSHETSALRINGARIGVQPEQVRSVMGFAVTAADELAAFGADIVLDFSGNAGLIPLVDAAYRARSASPPFYVLPPARSRWPILLEQIENDESLRTRILGLNYASATDLTLYNEYMRRLRAVGPSGVDLESMENVYDAVYFAIYAAVAGTPGGTGQAKGFLRLLTGPRRDIGPNTIQSVVDRLRLSSEATLSLHGPGGTPDFHRPTGSRMAYGNVWCIDENIEYVADALRYDPMAADFPGSLPCFAF
jgi:hypothetical protein